MEMSPIDPTPMIERIAAVLDGDKGKARQVLAAIRRPTPDAAVAMCELGQRELFMSFSPSHYGDYDLCCAQLWIAGVERELKR